MLSMSQGLPRLLAFTNTHACVHGELVAKDIYFSPDTGLICPDYSYRAENVQRIDLRGEFIVAPGFLELQTNGLAGVHFTSLGRKSQGDGNDEESLLKVASMMLKNGVTGWWATVPTVSPERWPEILSHLSPRTFRHGSPLLGAHVEGPYLHPTKKGAHDESFFQKPNVSTIHQLYGKDSIPNIIRLITLAPELDGALDLIKELKMSFPKLVISLGHSTATYQQGLDAVRAGATCLTHAFNAMNPLHHREPGLAGLIALPSCPQDPMESPSPIQRALNTVRPTQPEFNPFEAVVTDSIIPSQPYFSLIPDLIHVHPAVLRLSYTSSPSRCILITDSIEVAGLPDGIYPPNGQITYSQRKVGDRVTNIPDPNDPDGKETLIGSCITLPEGVRNMVDHAGIGLAEAVRCVTENVANLMGESRRGVLEIGRRADFVILNKHGHVTQTWIGGIKVWDSEVDIL